jgi:Zn-dependent protease
VSITLERVIFFIVAIPAIVFHEVAHGYVANRLGDPTAKVVGRLSLNPLKHVDLFGTILMPAMLALAGLPVFGYAKPVPIDPRNFKNMRWGMLWTGLAGPATNLVLAASAGLVVRVLGVLGLTGSAYGSALTLVLYLFADINLVLMFFNLIPIPPFDGSRVLPVFLSDSAMRVYARVEQYGFFIILALLYFGQGIVGAYFEFTVNPLLRLFTGV